MTNYVCTLRSCSARTLAWIFTMLDAVTNQAIGALELEWSIYSYTQLHVDFFCMGVANLYEDAIRSNLVLNTVGTSLPYKKSEPENQTVYMNLYILSIICSNTELQLLRWYENLTSIQKNHAGWNESNPGWINFNCDKLCMHILQHVSLVLNSSNCMTNLH